MWNPSLRICLVFICVRGYLHSGRQEIVYIFNHRFEEAMFVEGISPITTQKVSKTLILVFTTSILRLFLESCLIFLTVAIGVTSEQCYHDVLYSVPSEPKHLGLRFYLLIYYLLLLLTFI